MEGDEPKFEEFDEEKENLEVKKKMKKGKEVSHVGATLQEQTPQGGRRPCCAGRHLDKVVDMPVVCKDRGSATVKVPQIQSIAECEDLPVVQRRGRTVQTVQLAAWCGVWRRGRR